MSVRMHHSYISTKLVALSTSLCIFAGCANPEVNSVSAPAVKDTTPSKRLVQPSKSPRSLADVSAVFKRNESNLYSAYNEALRNNPTLAGDIVFRLSVAPSGEVQECSVVHSTLANSDLENRLVSRLKKINFGAQDVDQLVVTFPLRLMPN